MQCGYCGASIPDNSAFCRQCGQGVSAPSAPPKSSSKTLWVVLGLGLAFLLITAVAVGGYWGYKLWKDKQKEEQAQKDEGGTEEADDEQPTDATRKSSGSKRISDAQYYEARRQWEQAMAEYQLALQENPDDYEAHYGLGNCYRKKRDSKKALSEYQKAIQLNPQYTPARRALGRLYAKQGDLDSAVEQLEAAKKADPKDPQVAKELANYRKRRARKGG